MDRRNGARNGRGDCDALRTSHEEEDLERLCRASIEGWMGTTLSLVLTDEDEDLDDGDSCAPPAELAGACRRLRVFGERRRN